MSSPWAKIKKPDIVNFQDIMSEQLAKELQDKENNKILENTTSVITTETDIVNSEDKSDHMIAWILQKEEYKAHDANLKRTEDKVNGTSKVTISFENFRQYLPDDSTSDLEEEVEDIIDRKDWDRFDTADREFGEMPACGYKMKDGEMVTKHDVTRNGLKNARKLLSFPPEFRTGDGANMNLNLPNKVFNSLKTYSKRGQKRRVKVTDKKEDEATAEFGIDNYTRIILYKFVSNGTLQNVNGIISIGKEALIIHSDGYPDDEKSSKECAIKVFKTTLSEFKQRDRYIKDDHRFKNRIGKQNSRKTVHIWAEKEMANLMRLKNAGILCPRVVAIKKHVLVMSFIGTNGRAAPKLKDVDPDIMEETGYIKAYNEIIEAMKTMYDEANLIHADLSEYNILWHKEHCYIIDVSQSVEPCHENAFSFLFRDCSNIINFFEKKDVPDLLTPHQLFENITGFDFDENASHADLKELTKPKPHLSNIGSTYNFDKAWELSKVE